MGSPVTHFDVSGPEPEMTAKFYSELFGWHSQAFPELNYTMIDTHAGGGINGGFAQTSQGQPSFVTFYAEVDDLQATLGKAESLGGKTVVPVTPIPNVVTFAMFADPQGNVIGIIQGGGEEGPGVSAGDNPKVDWFEVLGPDPQALWSFYRELFGWQIKESSAAGGFAYGQVEVGEGRGIPGGIGATPDGQPHVNVYAGVDDLQKYIDRADQLGGTTVMPPMKVDERTSVAVIRDPQGTTFGLYVGM
jgi:uncharacterized protein